MFTSVPHMVEAYADAALILALIALNAFQLIVPFGVFLTPFAAGWPLVFFGAIFARTSLSYSAW